HQQAAAVAVIAESMDQYNLSNFKKRVMILDKLREFNLPAYIPASLEDLGFPGKTNVKESVYANSYSLEYWNSIITYSVLEIQAYLESIGNNSTPLDYMKECFACDSPYGRFRKPTVVVQRRSRIVVYIYNYLFSFGDSSVLGM